jgi:hypothetical protein
MMFFHFLKIIFDISTSKRSKKYKPHSILAKKNKLKFDQKQVQPQSQTGSNKHKRAEEKEQGQIKTAFSADTNDIWAPFTLSLSFFCLLMINILLEPNFLQKIISI